MVKKLKELSLDKEVISDLSDVNGGNTYAFGCDGAGTLTYRRTTACISICTRCAPPPRGGGSTAASQQSFRAPRPCMCQAC